MAPFLEVITRYFKRPRMFRLNRLSLQVQTCQDWMQTVLIDNLGQGVAWANENLGAWAPKLQGEYIWILDDDDQCIRPTFVAELLAIATELNPDVIMVKMDHKERRVLPDVAHWGQPPAHGFIGCSAYVVKRQVWQQHAAAWYPGTYYSDFNFIAAVFNSGPKVYWHDVIASEVQRISLGQPERG